MKIHNMIHEYLKDKQVESTDHLDITEGRITGWYFKNVPQPTMEELEALIPVLTAKEETEKGKKDNKKSKRDQRISKLKTLDWSKIKTIADAKDVLQVLAEEILKDEE